MSSNWNQRVVKKGILCKENFCDFMRQRVWLQWRHFNEGCLCCKYAVTKKNITKKTIICAWGVNYRGPIRFHSCLWVVWSRACQDLVTVKDETRGIKERPRTVSFFHHHFLRRKKVVKVGTGKIRLPSKVFMHLFFFSSPGFVVGKLAPNNFNFPNLEHQIWQTISNGDFSKLCCPAFT